MARYLALLRGINVGGHQKIAMADLRQLLGGLGHTDVSTFLQSGNALFTSARRDRDKLALDIERAIKRKLGLSVRCLVRGREDLQRIVDGNPMGKLATDPSRLLVAFLSAKPDAARVRAIDAKEFAPEEFRVGQEEIYLWSPDGVHKSKFTQSFFEKKLGGLVATARNWNTVTKLLAMMS